MDQPKNIGGKAAGLLTLRSLGYLVPDFVVLRQRDIQDERWKQQIASLGEGPFAVRSSASMEDGVDHSFAGQYESFLNVRIDSLEKAIQDCFSS